MMHTQGVDMTHGPLSRKIWLMAIPLALTGVIQQFFNAADIAMIGRFVDEQSMAAVGGCAPLITTLLSLFIGLSIGTNVVLAGFIGYGAGRGAYFGYHGLPLRTGAHTYRGNGRTAHAAVASGSCRNYGHRRNLSAHPVPGTAIPPSL